MGLYDRDYVQYDPSREYAPAGRRSIVTTLIIVNVAIFVVDMLTPEVSWFDGRVSSHALGDFLALKADLWTHPWNCWQLITYGFAHAPIDSRSFIFHVGMNMYGLWLFGRDVESTYGSKEFLRVYLALIVLSGACWAVLAANTAKPGTLPSLAGASGAVAGVVILFVMNFPRRRFHILFVPGVPIPAWGIGVAFVVINLFGAMGAGMSGVAYSAHLAGAAFGFLYFRTKINLGRLAPGGVARLLRPKRPLRIHDPDRRSDRRTERRDQQADEVLEKLHRQGEASLTPRERRILEEYSRRMQQKHQ